MRIIPRVEKERDSILTKRRQGLIGELNRYFETEVNIPRIRKGERQEIETLIDEEAFLFAKYLRGERPSWNPRIVELS